MALHYAKKTDVLLACFALFDLINTLLFIFGYLNWSFDAIILIFSLGTLNLLFALLIFIRSRRSNYQYDYGPIKSAQSSYYVRTIFGGAVFIAIILALSLGLFAWIAHAVILPKVSPESVSECIDSLAKADGLSLSDALKFTLNYASCSLGESHMFTLVGMAQNDFIVSLMQRLFQHLTSQPVYFQYLLYVCVGIILLPFIWLFYRMIHLLNCQRKDLEP